MLVDDIKKRIPQAMKDKKVVERDILRVALSEIQNHENRSGKPPTEEEASKIIRKVIKSNEETLLVATSEETKAKLLEENGRAGKKTIGFPLTLHFGGSGGAQGRGSMTCNVVGPKGEKVEEEKSLEQLEAQIEAELQDDDDQDDGPEEDAADAAPN
mgnify:CR=1 FL=1